ncbi:unnamed protein product [Parajaminaea phylloscopi]
MTSESYRPRGSPVLAPPRSQAINLPRLQIMDSSRDHPHPVSDRRTSFDGPARHRSLSSGSQSGLAAFGPFSPLTESGISSRSILSSMPRSHVPGREPSRASMSMAFPSLPEPVRRSTMMDGSLPPLSAMKLGPQSHRTTAPLRAMSGGEDDDNRGAPQSRPPLSPPLPSSTSAPSVSASPSYLRNSLAPRGMTAAAQTSPGTDTASPASTSALTSTSASAGAAADGAESSSRKAAKAHVSSACLNCKRAHLACDAERPCRRCTKLGKTATCVDVQHKKRGRPRLKDRGISVAASMEAPSIPSAACGTIPSPWAPHPDAVGDRRNPSARYPLPATSSPMPPWAGPPSSSSAPHIRPSHGPYSSAAGRSRPYGEEVVDAMGRRSFSARSSPQGESSPAQRQVSPRGPPALVPDLHADSSFVTPRQHGVYTESTVSFLCGTDFVTEAVSQEARTVFGLLPSQLTRRSLLDLVHPRDIAYLERAWNSLVQPVGLGLATFPSGGLKRLNLEPAALLVPARGTIFVEETMRMRLSETVWAPCSVRLHLGGALGLDLYRPDTKDGAYVVCSIYPIDENGTPSTQLPPAHPDVALLRGIEYPPVSSRLPLETSRERYSHPADHDGQQARWMPPPAGRHKRPAYFNEQQVRHGDTDNAPWVEEGRKLSPALSSSQSRSPAASSSVKLRVDIPQRLPRLAALHVSPLHEKAVGAECTPPTSESMPDLAPTPSPVDRWEPSPRSASSSSRSSPSAASQYPFSSYPRVSHGGPSGASSLFGPPPPPFATARATVASHIATDYKKSHTMAPSLEQHQTKLASRLPGRSTHGDSHWALSC